MNLPAAGWLGIRRHRALLPARARHGPRFHVRGLREKLRGLYWHQPGVILLSVATAITIVAASLEAANPANGWLLFEDVACFVAPFGAAMAVGWAALRCGPESRAFRAALAISLGLTATGQAVADIPDILGHPFALVSSIANIFHVVGAVLGIATLFVGLFRRVPRESRRDVLLDGLVLMAVAITLVVANWLRTNFESGGGMEDLWSNPIVSLVLPVASSILLATAAAAVVAALSLKMEPALKSAWALIAGVTLITVAWQGWIGRFVAGGPDTIEPMDFLMPAGALLCGLGGVTWNYRRGGGAFYDRLSAAIMEWLPIAAIVGCALLDVMPRSRPFQSDPIALGTFIVVLLAMARYRLILGRERDVSQRLTTERSDRAATTVSLARLETGTTVEETAERICAEAMRIGGIDTVIVFAFTDAAVVPLARGGPQCRPVEVGEALPDEPAQELREHAEFGLWLESWVDRVPRNDFDRVVAASGLKAEALAPLIWNDETVGLLAMGATAPSHARRLADRLPTVTEFAVMSAAVLGPALSERAQKEKVQAVIRSIIADRAFEVVFQPIVELESGKYVGFEALARFSDGTRPDLRFLEADRVGMMVQLETAVLRAQVARAHRLPEGSFVSLNVSPTLAMAVVPLLDVLSEADRAVVLEITEHLEIDDYPKLMAALDRVRGHAMLAVDDAGSGYAGLRHILELRPQYVKLDISLVRNVDSDPARQAMVTGMAYFAASAGCSLIAEGIETPEELEALRLLGAEYGQGYLLARPSEVV